MPSRCCTGRASGSPAASFTKPFGSDDPDVSELAPRASRPYEQARLAVGDRPEQPPWAASLGVASDGHDPRMAEADHDLGRGHGIALVHVIKNGSKIDAKQVGSTGAHREENDTLGPDGELTPQ